MRDDAHRKVSAGHLQRSAYLYVRQSTLRQVFEHGESTKRQYALRDRALALGWPAEQIVVIDSDLGQSGASAADREGFQRLVTEVGMGRAGIVMGLEVSRLARNSSDWHRLLEICALADTLILDEDGIYDPAHFNDRLLLGLKGTMSEAELHVLKARLQGGILNKARRGELETQVPIGFAYDSQNRVVLDPDLQVREAVGMLFETFRRTGTAVATVKAFREQGWLFPRRVRAGLQKGDLIWNQLETSRTLWVLHNPRYAGAFFYGRTRQRKNGLSGRYKKLPREEWVALVVDAHSGYITWEEFEENQRRLRDNSAAYGCDRRHSPPREGPALIQGLVICGRCGRRMTIRYDAQAGGAVAPTYTCLKDAIERDAPACQLVPGARVDTAVAELLVEAMTPMAIDVALAVDEELKARAEEADKLRLQQVERARYEAELARRRYLQVDPDNRLVAASLEAEWNEKLRRLNDAQDDYERQRQASGSSLDQAQRADLLRLATDFPRLWHNIGTSHRDRKRMVRLLIEDVTIRRDTDGIAVQVRFKGGTTREVMLDRPKPAWELRQTARTVVDRVDALLDQHTDAQIAEILNEEGLRSGENKSFSRLRVRQIRLAYGLKPLFERLREAGLLSQAELAERLGVAESTIKLWRRQGFLKALAYSDRNDYLYPDPGENAPVRYQHKWKQRAAASGSRETTAATSK